MLSGENDKLYLDLIILTTMLISIMIWMNLDFSDQNCIGSENEIENDIDVVFHSILPYPAVANVNYLIVEFLFQ